MSVVTVTLNPSLDRTLEIATLDRGQVNRATVSRVDPGGKGVNVARALVANGIDAVAVLPLGGHEGDQLAVLVEHLGVATRPVGITGPVRTNVSLVEPDGTVTKINAAGPTLDRHDLDHLIEEVLAVLDGPGWVAACGSLPPGAPDDTYAQLAEEVHDRGGRIAIDTSGAPLAAAATAAPDVLKPNAHELADLVGRELTTFGDVVAGARRLRDGGVGAVLVSLGADGAVLVDGTGAVHADTPPLTPRSNVGAGDAALAGFLAATTSGTEAPGSEALRQAVAWGAAAVRLPGTSMPGPADIDLAEVRIHDVDPDRPLSDRAN